MKVPNVIIIPFHTPWVWTSDYPTQTAIMLSHTHTVICFLWADAKSWRELVVERRRMALLTRVNPNLLCYSPIHFVPGRRFRVIAAINYFLNLMVFRLLLRHIERHPQGRIILWLFGLYEPLFRFLPAWFPKAKTLYYSVDYPWHPDNKQAVLIKQEEKKLLRQASWFLVTSESLKEYYQPIRSDAFVVPLVFDSRLMQKSASIPRIPRRSAVIGYVGSLDYRIDIRLLESLIKRNPHWTFALVGPVLDARFTTLFQTPNVFHYATLDKSVIAGLVSQFTVGIVPYDIRLLFNRYCFPLKVREYFYFGKPVVSTPIIELMKLGWGIRIGRSVQSWEILIRQLLATPPPAAIRRRQRAFVSDISPRETLETIDSILTERGNQ